MNIIKMLFSLTALMMFSSVFSMSQVTQTNVELEMTVTVNQMKDSQLNVHFLLNFFIIIRFNLSAAQKNLRMKLWGCCNRPLLFI